MSGLHVLDAPERPVHQMVPMHVSSVGYEEEQLVIEVLRSGQLASGAKVELFEAACAVMAGTSHAVAVVNGTAALELLLEGLGIGPGDEVITTSFTFAATVSAIIRCGATARLVDIGADHTIDVGAVEAAIGPRTAAVLPVHLYGQPADLVRLAEMCDKRGLALIEDAAQAHGADVNGRPVGGWGHGVFSFYATKNVSCGEGGAICTDDETLSRRLRLLRNHGMERRHHHELVGRNLRMSELHAAVGLPAMARLPQTNRLRRRNSALLSSGLADVAGLSLPVERAGSSHVWHQYTVLADARDELAGRLLEQGIQTGVHYPMLVSEQEAYRHRQDVIVSECPTALRASRECLSLPVHEHLSEAQIVHLVTTVSAG